MRIGKIPRRHKIAEQLFPYARNAPPRPHARRQRAGQRHIKPAERFVAVKGPAAQVRRAPARVDRLAVVVVVQRVGRFVCKCAEPAVRRAEPQRAVLLPQHAGRDIGAVKARILARGIGGRAVRLRSLQPVQNVRAPVQAQPVHVFVNQRERFLQPVFLQQLPVQEEAAALAVFFPGNVLRRDGVNAQLCQKQRLRAQISKRIRPDGSLALQNVHDGERGLVVHKGSLPHDHVPVGIGGILVRRQPGVYNGISHNGAVALAQHRIGLVSPVGGVVQSAVPVIVDELRAAGQKQTVRRAVHAELDADAAFVDAVRIALNRV